MKNIKTWVLAALALPLALFTSCTSDEDDVFNNSSSQRMENAIDAAKAVLRGNTNGWIMDYYVGDDQQYGGYAYIVKFDSLTVTAYSELDTINATSYYKVTNDNGCSLNFDSYNKVLHSLATPSENNYEAYHADYEFQVMSATAEKVVLKGKKTGNVCTLRPLTTTPEEYLEKVANVVDSMIVATAEGQLNGQNVNVSFDLDNRAVEITAGSDSLSSAFVYTDKGIRLYQALQQGDDTVSEFSYDPATMQFACTDSKTSFSMQGALPDTYVQYADYAGDYYLTFISGSTGQLTSIDVTLTPAGDGSTYNMTGLFDQDVTVSLEYSRSAGNLFMPTQVIGTVDGNLLWLQAASYDDGLYPGASIFGMETLFNKDREHPVYDWKSNENDYLDIDSWCMWLTDTDGNNVGQYRSGDYTFKGGYIMLPHMKQLIKK